MTESLPSIDLELPSKIKERNYRRSYFIAETSALIAKQLINLRRRRGLNQTQVAELLDTGQPAISRMERADYRNWSFNTLRRLAEAMDARIRVLIEPAEDVLHEYDPQQISAPDFVLDMRDMNKLLDAIIRSDGNAINSEK
jgi:transcriptional regulator with XRE-family HTH domain